MQFAFNCPSCGANLENDGSKAAVRCEYCGQSVVVPFEMRSQPPPQPIQQVVINQVPDRVEVRQLSPEDQAKVQKTLRWVVILIVVTTVVPILISIFVGVLGAVIGFVPLCIGALAPLIAIFFR